MGAERQNCRHRGQRCVARAEYAPHADLAMYLIDW